MKPWEQALSNAALVLLLCTWEYVTPDRESSDLRSVCPREKNVNFWNIFIPLLQVLRDKQYSDGSSSRQHHIQTTQWWAQNKYQDCKIDLPSKEIELWHERRTRMRKHQTQQTIILKDVLFAANGGIGTPHFRIAEVQPTVINCRRQLYKMDKVCSWEQPPNITLPVLEKQRKKSIVIRLYRGWATLPSIWLRLKTELHFALSCFWTSAWSRKTIPTQTLRILPNRLYAPSPMDTCLPWNYYALQKNRYLRASVAQPR